MPRLTFVLGAGRSGTSLVSRIFEACGAQLGGTNGFAENRQAKYWINHKLHAAGFDQFGQYPLPDAPIMSTPRDVAHLKRICEGVDLIKDVKFVWVWPTLLEAFPEAHFVLCYRTPQRIAESCIEAPFMRAYEDATAWEVWARAYQSQCQDLSNAAPGRCSWVVPDALATGGDFALRSAVACSGLQWTEEADRVFDPKQWSGG